MTEVFEEPQEATGKKSEEEVTVFYFKLWMSYDKLF